MLKGDNLTVSLGKENKELSEVITVGVCVCYLSAQVKAFPAAAQTGRCPRRPEPW